MKIMGIATIQEDLSAYFTGDARLYLVEPSVTYESLYGKHKATDFVVVSAVDAPFTGPETYIFPANADGEVLDWGELAGSFRGELNHERALKGAGYEMGEGA